MGVYVSGGAACKLKNPKQDHRRLGASPCLPAPPTPRPPPHLLPLLQLHSSVATALRAVMRREGAAGLYRGVTAMALGAG